MSHYDMLANIKPKEAIKDGLRAQEVNRALAQGSAPAQEKKRPPTVWLFSYLSLAIINIISRIKGV
jgi:hypothetical protein